MTENKEALDKDFTIAVAGETESLVRSFMNVLVGSEVIPYFLVTEPSIVCSIHAIPYEDEQSIHIQMANNEEDIILCGNISSLKKTWKTLQATLKGKTCHRVEICWHLPYFRNTKNVKITSNPFNEDSEKMASFVSDASILIYVWRRTKTTFENEDKVKLF
ncbi:hypothetical protein DPMN_155678 [Dreissena polymorpha]|uniref:Uncharacterized protein n=1 Tax=Dreissena polymorpha TaxID=45954 RepID=A0A9D4JBK9_DREPO|nr:hypothetical protein DPMN_155678 [Dreissena polymorpha]